MWICVDGRVFQEEKYGGVKEYAANLLQAVLRLDRENQYVIFSNEWGGQKTRANFDAPNLHQASFSYPNKLLNLSLTMLGFPRLDELAEKEIFRKTGKKIKFDFFWSPNINFVSLSSSVKFLLSVHDLSFWAEPGFFSLKERIWHGLVGPERLFNRADALLPVSLFTAGDLAARGFSKRKMAIISPAISADFLSNRADISEVRRFFNLPKKYILSFAAKGKRKNFTGVIRAFKSANLPEDLHLVIAGEGTETLRSREEKILFLGRVPKEFRPALYKDAQFFVYPSFYEGFGLPVLEAAASGTPVITSATTSLPEILGDSSVLINPHDLSELRFAMETLANSESLRSHLAEEALKKATLYSWDDSAEKLLAQFKK